MARQMNFEQFKKSPFRNQWICEYKILRMYVRKTIPAWKEKRGDFEFASLISSAPGSGLLTRFLDKYEPQHQFYIENIINERLLEYFRRRGYDIIYPDSILPSALSPKPDIS